MHLRKASLFKEQQKSLLGQAGRLDTGISCVGRSEYLRHTQGRLTARGGSHAGSGGQTHIFRCHEFLEGASLGHSVFPFDHVLGQNP
jgi:hypothetical protein